MKIQRITGEDVRPAGGTDAPTMPRQTIMIERELFYASVRSAASRALVADARALQASAQFPPTDPPELPR